MVHALCLECTTPVVSVRETEVQTNFKLPITGIPGLHSDVQRIPFSLLLLTEREMLTKFVGLKTLKFVAKAHVTLAGMLFLLKCRLGNLPFWWPDSTSSV